tara:strand:- start:2433 stop:3272 length:840 start_codon:yes stop_codon:yes gene_type:complete
MLKLIVISRRFDDRERKLFARNCVRLRRVFGSMSCAYVLGERVEGDAGHLTDPDTRFFLVTNVAPERNAALSRGVGYQALSVAKHDLVLFLDGDMLVSEAYLRFLKALPPGPVLALSDRVDIHCSAGGFTRRRRAFRPKANGRFGALYGSMALRGIDFTAHNMMTHDMEEQWFLRQLSGHPARHESFPQIGILHFDRFVGASRWARYVTSARGVGFWQGLFRSFAPGRIYDDTRFFLAHRKTVKDLLKFLAASAISLPKIFMYPMPKRMSYEEITDERR